jgi:hypothetical protein
MSPMPSFKITGAEKIQTIYLQWIFVSTYLVRFYFIMQHKMYQAKLNIKIAGGDKKCSRSFELPMMIK